jgi:hypothetical protein
MIPYEIPGRPVLDDPTCGRPEGHQGMCRSKAALSRKYSADVVRITEVRQVLGVRYGKPRRDSTAVVRERAA